MNDYRETPQRLPDKRKIITNKFPKDFPIFWGPNQKILEDDKYVEPTGFIDRRCLINPKVVRFITDAHEEDATIKPSCTFRKGHIFSVPDVPIFSVTFQRKIGTTYLGGAYWLDWPGADSDPSADPLGRGISQAIDATTGALIVTQPDIRVKFSDGHVETRLFQEAFDAGHTEIYFWFLFWRWYNEADLLIGETNKSSPIELHDSPIPGIQLLSGVDTNPVCPTDYFTGCPCLP